MLKIRNISHFSSHYNSVHYKRYKTLICWLFSPQKSQNKIIFKIAWSNVQPLCCCNFMQILRRMQKFNASICFKTHFGSLHKNCSTKLPKKIIEVNLSLYTPVILHKKSEKEVQFSVHFSPRTSKPIIFPKKSLSQF